MRRRDRGLRRQRPDDVAAAWGQAVVDLPVEGCTPRVDARTLLLLPKTGGTEDVLATLAGRGDVGLRLAALDRAEIKAAFRALIGDGHERLRDVDYRPDDADLAAAKARYREFLVPVMQRLKRERDLAGVVSANVTYYAERELAAACEAVGLPFLVLHKESIRSPRQREAFTRAYALRTGPFTGRSVATYNRDERDAQVAGGVVTDATVVGCPRIDALHRWRERRAAAARDGATPAGGPIVLFAIDHRAGSWTPFDGEPDGAATEWADAPRWEELARTTEAAFVDLAGRYPNHPFVLKAKVGRGVEQLRRRLATHLPGGLPANVTVVTSGTATELIGEAAVLIAFNSTVIAEGLAAGVPVVVPEWAEAAHAEAQPWLYPVGSAVNRVRTPDDLATVVLAAQAAHRRPRTDLALPAAEALDRLVGNSDGRAGDRAWAWMGAALSG